MVVFACSQGKEGVGIVVITPARKVKISKNTHTLTLSHIRIKSKRLMITMTSKKYTDNRKGNK